MLNISRFHPAPAGYSYCLVHEEAVPVEQTDHAKIPTKSEEVIAEPEVLLLLHAVRRPMRRSL